MPRDPVPPVGVPFEDGFAATLANATLLNPAVHDGAIMIGRVDPAAPYVVSGWSFRLYAKPPASSVGTNRGSAFNSCIAMSLVAGIDGIYLISKLGVERCVLGKSVSL
jgi:hypothetical protein